MNKKTLLIALFFSFGLPSILLAQEIENIYIEVRTDHNPGEISWSISDEEGNVLILTDEEIAEPYTFYSWQYPVEKGECYRFDIYDTGGDGIDSSGFYRLRRGDLWYQGEQYSFSDQNFHYTGECTVGNICEEPLTVTSGLMYTSGQRDFWFELSSETSTSYSIYTCQSFNSEKQRTTDTKVWIYDGCPRELYDSPQGALAVNEDFVSCAPGAGIYGYPIQRGRKYYIRIRNQDPGDSSRIPVSFVRADVISGCMDLAACNYNPLATEDSGNCIYDNCLPDLEVGYEEFISSIQLDTIEVEDECLLEESCVTGTGLREIVRFTTAVYNIGDADYVVGNPQVDNRGFSIDNCHGHWHRLGYAEYILFQDDGLPAPLGFKNGFCLFDLSCGQTELEPKYSCEYMGISAGCYDIYDASIDCQWLDITDIPDGDYTLVVRVNWSQIPDLRGLSERTYDNNWVQACINIARTEEKTTLTIKGEECAVYRDCFGKAYGSALLDCEGVCGGTAHYGDIDQDLQLTEQDQELYLDALLYGEIPNTPCYDLSGDSIISVYDLALISDCISDSDEEDLFHTHCVFPRRIVDTDTNVEFEIMDHDQGGSSIDITLKSNNPIGAFHIRLDGINNIKEVVSSPMADIRYSGDNEIVLWALDDQYSAELLDDITLTIAYDSLISEDLCISEVWDMVTSNYKLVDSQNVTIPQCNVSTSIENLDNYGISIFPNPTADVLHVLNEYREPVMIELYSSDGVLILSRNGSNSTQQKLDLSGVQSGVYVAIISVGQDKYAHRFIKL